MSMISDGNPSDPHVGEPPRGQDGDAGPWQAPVATGPLHATVEVPGSKSLSNRYLVLAALGSRAVTVRGVLRSRDTDLMMEALRTLGAACAPCDGDPTTVRVTPPDQGVFTGRVHIDCGLAGTVMRFLPGLALFADGPVSFDGDAQAYRRPMRPVLDGLEQLGARVDYLGEQGFLPFTITPPSSITGDTVAIDSSGSSQFVSGLLLIASRLPHGLSLRHTGGALPSMPHIRMTMHDIALCGGSVRMPQEGEWIVGHGALQLPRGITVEPDLSNAAPFLGSALLAGGGVSVPHWPYRTTQPGGMVPDILGSMGARVWLDDHECTGDDSSTATVSAPTPHASGVLRVSGTGSIHGLGTYDLSAAGEVAPTIAALAVFGDTPTTLVGIGHLRGHETNRLAALVDEIRRIGGSAEELEDGLSITPVDHALMRPATMRTYADHRMATFAAMIGLRLAGTTVENIATTRKTLPDFPGMWAAMLG
ncbi:3-phosphoshikimate 1-carboxyvinyltransferase [Bifidobacterium mongoliense]|uniref:3-phosphoshikimate 1-carboxyvinyltransferase n=1 Tax=Bifidobacterium mongoliense TaxID=518643 RepID=UPI0030ECB320